MNYKSILNNLRVALASQGTSLLLSLIMSLLVPKVLGINGFSYWQLFLFYANYVGFFHFGLNDGLYLLNGGKTRREIDLRSISSQFWITLAWQFTITLGVILVVSFLDFDGERKFVIYATALYMLVYNASSFLGYLFQSVNETKLYSFSVMISKVAYLAPLAILLLLRTTNFELYIVFYLASQILALAFCLYHGRFVFRRDLLPFTKAVCESFHSIRVGVKLMVANIASSLILGIARLTIDLGWGIQAFGKFSFALSIANFILLFVTQVGMVLFPALRRAGYEELRYIYRRMRLAMELTLPGAYLLFFPAKWFVSAWLPQYSGTLDYLALLAPLCVFDGKMNMVGGTYLKVLRRESLLLGINLSATVVSICGVVAAAIFLRSIEAVIIVITLTVIGRSLLTDVVLSRTFEIPFTPTLFVELFLTLLFMADIFLFSPLVALAMFAVAYGLYLYFFRSDVTKLVKVALHTPAR